MSDHSTSHHDDPGYEKRDISVPRTIVVALFVVLLIVGFIVVLNEYFISVAEEIKYEQVLAPESAGVREQRAREIELLSSYDVINAEDGVYRIPVRRAMELMADEAFRKQIK